MKNETTIPMIHVEPEQIRTVLGDAFVNADGSKATTGAIAIGTDGKTIRVSTNYMIEPPWRTSGFLNASTLF